MTQLSLDITNPQLAALAARKYENKYTQVPNGKLPSAFSALLGEFYKRLTGKDLDAEASTLSIAADAGKFKAVYGPSLYASTEGDKLVIQWGREVIELTPNKGGTFEGINPETLSISFAAVAYGNSMDAVLRLMFFNEADEDFSMDIKPRPLDYQVPLVAETLNNLLSRNPKKAVAFFAPQPELNSFDGPSFSAGDLEEGVYVVQSYRAIETKWGKKHMLLCDANPELKQPVPFELWSDSTSSAILSLNPTISLEAPALLTIWGTRQTKRNTIAANQTLELSKGALGATAEGALDLDF